MNMLYIMLGFIFVYAMISNARDKIKKRDEKSKEAFERLQSPAYKKELEKGDPSYLSKDKPHYYSEEIITKVLNDRKEGNPFSSEEISRKMNIVELIEKESARAGEAEDSIENTITTYDDEYSYSSEDPYSYENMVQPEKIRKKAKQLKLEIILETILEKMGYKFEEEEFYSDLLKNAEAEAYMDDTELLPINILEKREKIKNPKKHYIKKIDKN